MEHGRDFDDHAWEQVRAEACVMVGELFDAADADQLLSAEPQSDFEFAEQLIDCELALIAEGEDPLRIVLRIAVLDIARSSVRSYAEIRALPEAAGGGSAVVAATALEQQSDHALAATPPGDSTNTRPVTPPRTQT